MCYIVHFAGFVACKIGLDSQKRQLDLKYAHMITKEIIREDNIREMEYPFGWIPQRFITSGIIKVLNKEEILLYIFLSIVSDKSGMSFYGDKRICGLLGVTSAELMSARFMLEKKGFIAYRKPYYQVLKMPRGG